MMTPKQQCVGAEPQAEPMCCGACCGKRLFAEELGQMAGCGCGHNTSLHRQNHRCVEVVQQQKDRKQKIEQLCATLVCDR